MPTYDTFISYRRKDTQGSSRLLMHSDQKEFRFGLINTKSTNLHPSQIGSGKG